MTVRIIGRILAATLLVASGPSIAAGYFLESRKATPDLYTYFGASWEDPKDERSHVEAQQFEARLIFPSDFEIAVSGQALREESAAGDVSDFGDTTVSIGKGWRCDNGIDFVSIEAGTVLPTAPDALTDDIDWYSRARMLGGWTRFGFDLSLTSRKHATPAPNASESSMVTSVGVRSQITYWHFGMDALLTTRDGFDDEKAIRFVTMRRGARGGALYGVVRKGIDGDSNEMYVGAGFELRFTPAAWRSR